ncbi:MAG TPA: hypothetical protein VGA10_13055, partial [Thermoanaerobaculia bacterium]
MFKVRGIGKLQRSHLILAAMTIFAVSSVWGQHLNVPVHPPAELVKFVLTSFTITPGSVTNGGVPKGHVTMSLPVGSQVVYVSLAQVSPGFAGVPPTIGIANGTSVDFDLATSLVNAPTNAKVSASY